MGTSCRSLSFLVAGAALLMAGCSSQTPQKPVQTGPVRQYALQGKVVGKDTESGELVVNGAEIPGFMESMTMPYKMKDPAALDNLYGGDEISGTLDVSADSTLLENVKVTSRKNEHRDPLPQSAMKPLVAGEAVPNFALTDQNGKTVHLGDWRGQLLLMTFIYTHCPLADYCPRMSRNFATIGTQLAKEGALSDKVHLLSVSFDPARDTPAVLKSYGGAYTGNYTHETFQHWTFAAPPQAELKDVLTFFDVDTLPGESGTLTHTLSTVLIDGNGKIVKWYQGNVWTTDEVLDDIRQAAKGATS